MEIPMDKIKKFFDKHDQYAKHSGIELLEVKKGYAKSKMDIHKHHLNGANTFHGGAIFTLADFTFAAASNSHGRFAMSINASISYIKAVSEGVLFAEAREVALNYKLATYLVEITNEKKDVIAMFQGTVYRKEGKLPV
jgi:acyl-CoA thioesterase